MALAGCTLLVAWGVDIFKLVTEIKDHGWGASAVSLAAETVTFGLVVIGTIVGKMHSYYSKRETHISSIHNDTNQLNENKGEWTVGVSNSDKAFTEKPNDALALGTALKRAGKAWKDLSPDLRQVSAVNRLKQLYIAAAPNQNECKTLYTALMLAATNLVEARNVFLEAYPNVALDKEKIEINSLMASVATSLNLQLDQIEEQQRNAIVAQCRAYLLARDRVVEASAKLGNLIGSFQRLEINNQYYCKLPQAIIYEAGQQPPPVGDEA